MTAEPQFREVPDEVLQRMNLTQERWHAIQVEQAKREARVPSAGDVAPDFELPVLGDLERTVRLSSFRDERAVALIFGSYT